MPKFSPVSSARLATCDERLRELFERVVLHFDCTILEGHRGEGAQNRYYHEGRSKLKYPHSRHNAFPSKAVDVAPYPVNWNDRERFYFFAGYVLATAREMGLAIRWGGDWDQDTEVQDQTFFDLPHFELREE